MNWIINWITQWRTLILLFGFWILLFIVIVIIVTGCDLTPSSDDTQRKQQEVILKQRNALLGMPAILNFREAKFMKEVLERRDTTIVTYTYNQSETFGCYNFISVSTGYPIPYATQYTNPQKLEDPGGRHPYIPLPQADPNGLFSPASAEGTWSLVLNPEGKEIGPTYSEPRLYTSPYKLADNLLCDTVITKYISTFAKAMRGEDVVKSLEEEKLEKDKLLKNFKK